MLRFADGPHPGMSSLINIFDFPDDEDPSIVYVENDTVMQEITRPAEVEAYQKTFARIRESALAPAATRTYLDQLTHPGVTHDRPSLPAPAAECWGWPRSPVAQRRGRPAAQVMGLVLP